MQLSSISGGTDICSCFVIGNPLEPPSIAARARARPRSRGAGIQRGGPAGAGERASWSAPAIPAQPIYFWGDENGDKYHAAYFERFDNIWCHGD